MIRIPLAARLWAFVLLAALAPLHALAAPFAAYVMDARTGKPIYAQNATTPLHPASLTKMMTLYLAFAAIERGQVRLDSKFTISSHAASEPPSRLGLRPGQQIELRYLIRAAAIKSANDAATAIGEGLGGSEAAFAQQMTATARALGMRNSQFRNANGLTQEGHYSTAEDLTILGRRLFYDFPQYYSIFSRRSADAGVAQVSSTNKRFLDEYPGADGIKTGYTRAAGFNLTASAQRGSKRIVATVLGGTSTAQRNQVMAQLLDAGFGRAPVRVREERPEPPELLAQKVVRRAQVAPRPVAVEPQVAALTLARSQAPRRVVRPSDAASTAAVGTPIAPQAPAAAPPAPEAPRAGAVLTASLRPPARPARPAGAPTTATAAAAPETTTASLAAPALAPAVSGAPAAGAATTTAMVSSARPLPAPRSRSTATAEPAPEVVATAEPAAAPAARGSLALAASPAPKPRSETVILAAMGEGDTPEPEATEIVRRSRGRGWSVSLGMFKSQAEADRLLLQTALHDGAVLEGSRRHVANTARGFEPRIAGISKAAAEQVCDRLNALQGGCKVIGN